MPKSIKYQNAHTSVKIEHYSPVSKVTPEKGNNRKETAEIFFLLSGLRLNKKLNKHKNRFKKEYFLLCLYRNVRKKHWSCIQLMKKKTLKNYKKKKHASIRFTWWKHKEENSTITQRKQQTWPSSSFSHFSIFFLFFYTSDVQNIIAPARTKQTTTTRWN